VGGGGLGVSRVSELCDQQDYEEDYGASPEAKKNFHFRPSPGTANLSKMRRQRLFRPGNRGKTKHPLRYYETAYGFAINNY
jgi:hypothetical protein